MDHMLDSSTAGRPLGCQRERTAKASRPYLAQQPNSWIYRSSRALTFPIHAGFFTTGTGRILKGDSPTLSVAERKAWTKTRVSPGLLNSQTNPVHHNIGVDEVTYPTRSESSKFRSKTRTALRERAALPAGGWAIRRPPAGCWGRPSLPPACLDQGTAPRPNGGCLLYTSPSPRD